MPNMMHVYVYNVAAPRKNNRFGSQWKMKETASFTSGTDSQTKGTDGLNDRETTVLSKQKLDEWQWVKKSHQIRQKPHEDATFILRQLISQSENIKSLRKAWIDIKGEVTQISHCSHSFQFSKLVEIRADKGLILLSMSIVDKEGLLLSEHASHKLACPLLPQS